MSNEPIHNFFSNDLVQDITQEDETNDNSISRGNIPNKESQERETAFESKLNKKLTRRLSKNLMSEKNLSIYRESLKDSGILENMNSETITIRELPKISEENYEKFKESIADKQALSKLCDDINVINCNFKSVDSNNSLGGISPLTYLIESSFAMSTKKAKEINDKYNKLKPYIYNYRTINGDGNCFYRAVMFRYLEILVLNRKVDLLQNVAYDVYNSFNSEELKSRLNIGKINLKPDLTLKLLIIIIDILKKGNVPAAYKLLIRSFSICRKFDYAIIFYFRYILYYYIKKNEEKVYIKSFPIKLGNLLPSQYETSEGKFLYESFYQNYLLKFYTDAEKIVIYLTPFVLGIPLNVIIFEDFEEEILQNFKWEEGEGLNLPDEIYLLNRKNHYEIIYTSKEYEKYKNIYENYENHQKSVILSNIDKYLKQQQDSSQFNMLADTFESKTQINNPKTMVVKRNNINKNNIDINQTDDNNNLNINKKSNSNKFDNSNPTEQNKINNNKNGKSNTDIGKDMNPKVQVKHNKNTILGKDNPFVSFHPIKKIYIFLSIYPYIV